MSAKRAATSNLTHENWDQEDPSDQEEMGTYKMAPKEVLEKRVFKTAKRRMRTATGDEPKKTSVFSSFGGFNKTQPSSFDFLSNLTNGSKTANGTSEQNDEAKPNLFNNGGSEKPFSLFSIPSTSPGTTMSFGTPKDTPKMTFGAPKDSPKVSFGTQDDATKMILGTPKDSPKMTFGAPKDLPKVTFGTQDDTSKLTFGTTKDSPQISFGTTNDAVKESSGTTNNAPKILFGIPAKESTSVSASPSLFMAPKSATPTSTTSKLTDSEPKQANFSFKPTPNSQPLASIPTSSSLFSVSAAASKSQFSMSSGSSTANSQPASRSSSTTSTTATTKSSETQDDTVKDKKIVYYTKLKGLNEAVSKWIQKHVEMTPLCILTPIFNDYQSYLTQLQDDYKGKDDYKDTVEETSSKTDKETSILASKASDKPAPSSIFGSANQDDKITSPFASKPSDKPSPSIFGSCTPSKPAAPFQATNSPNPTAKDAKPSFSFGINPSTPKSATESAPVSTFSSASSPPAGGFSFGIKTNPAPVTSTANSLFASPTSTSSPPSAPFSFGLTGQKFNFSPNAKKTETEESKKEEEDEDQPPKTVYTPIVEENSVYDKKCKVFVKKDGNFADIGVGTLYIKTVENSSKHQLLVRANTNLGTVLVNLILASAIPLQRMGKNNVMMICIPTPDSKPPPTSVLLRVKTSEEADELLETLNKYKV